MVEEKEEQEVEEEEEGRGRSIPSPFSGSAGWRGGGRGRRFWWRHMGGRRKREILSQSIDWESVADGGGGGMEKGVMGERERCGG